MTEVYSDEYPHGVAGGEFFDSDAVDLSQRQPHAGSTTVESYDQNYPRGIGGHRQATSINVGEVLPVVTTYGPDYGFNGDTMAKPDEPTFEGISFEETVDAIKSRETDSLHRLHAIKIDDTAEFCNFGNLIFQANGATKILPYNRLRRSVTIVNQGTSLVGLYRATPNLNPVNFPVAFGNQPANCVFIAAGASREIRYRGPVFVVGQAGAIVDWVEEIY